VRPLAARQTARHALPHVKHWPDDVCQPENLQSLPDRQPHEYAEHPSSHRISLTADHQTPYSTLTVLRPSQHIENAPAFTLTSSIQAAVAGALPIMPNDFDHA
jgi:hypothetical protein